MLVNDRLRIKEQLAFFTRRGIRISRAPRQILLRARQIVEKLERGEPYWKLHGKRLGCNRFRISIPLGRDWRILADDVHGRVVVREVLSHEKYNLRA